jgi:FAD/FMN-containing dehydrogenase
MQRPHRRSFLKAAAAAGVGLVACAQRTSHNVQAWVNDVHSRLNRTRVRGIVHAESREQVIDTVASTAGRGAPVSTAGSRHAMGGQQFRTDGVLLDMTRLNRVVGFDPAAGTIDVEGGIEWPEVINFLIREQAASRDTWGIRQKQTGADRMTIGGAISANAHGRGLSMAPFIADIESFELVDANGDLRVCSREQNRELFSLAAGGYGLFGVIVSARLRLAPRSKLERSVREVRIESLIDAFDESIADGALYGDWQYSIDERSSDFLRAGVLSCYRPVDPATPIPRQQQRLTGDDWRRLLYQTHAQKARAYRTYRDYYLSTSGQIYWSDTHQLSTYLDDYHLALDERLRSTTPATDIITEIYVPRPRLADFMQATRADFLENDVNVIYGTVRLIEKDEDSFLAWARQPYACVIFNLHTEHSPAGLDHSAEAFRRLIDLAIQREGSYYLTYHRFARRDQVEACYPQFERFLTLKREFDPRERFQSDWYNHHKRLLAGS